MATSAAPPRSGNLDQVGQGAGGRIRALRWPEAGWSPGLRNCGRGQLHPRRRSTPRLRAFVESRILQFPSKRIGGNDELEILLDSEHLHDGHIRANGHSGAAPFDASQGHWRHAGPLGDLSCGQAAAEPRKAQSVTKLPQQLLGNRQQGSGRLSHDVNILAVNHRNSQNIYTTHWQADRALVRIALPAIARGNWRRESVLSNQH